ncbi:aminopeptidase [Tenacibaculum pacificus]|uniref:aminopeptidase n=1 Tax=Tenacibaculum pacificus TaxID=3018314 RepID=UPI0022F3B5AA|nr:aminopeptidase [Tenacibaculum pacificus]WBX74203.1 aminopeptidase [Tenacibaculum pacificus]
MYCYTLTAQTNSIEIKAKLDVTKNQLYIQQKTVFYNNSSDNLKSVFLHNWANSFKNNDTPLGKRFIEDYSKNFHFAKEKDRGNTKIYSVNANYKHVSLKKIKADIIEVVLNKTLKPKDSVLISATYIVKIPSAKFTRYGKTQNGYHLRFWHITPAVYNKKWHLMSNLNIDDLYENPTNYIINIDIPKKYTLESNLYQHKTTLKTHTNYYLVGNRKKDIIIHIDSINNFTSFKTKNKEIKTDTYLRNIPHQTTSKIINKQIDFIEGYLGKHPHTEIFVDASTVTKNSLHEIYRLPHWLNPFPTNFKWEINFFKALTRKYIEDILLLDKRSDYWLTDGLETFLMMKYIKEYYPEVTVLGKYSKYWPLKTYNISKLKQLDKYAFVYQFNTRKFNDQALNTPSDSLSNFNRKIVNKYKAGLGLLYLQDFIGGDTLVKSIQEFYAKNQLKISTTQQFQEILQKNTSKNLDWFFDEYIKTTKKIDYKITKVKSTKNNDSLEVIIKNKRNFTSPIALYGIQKKEIKFKKWVTGIDSVKTIKIKKGNFDKLALNFENTYPEYNYLNNFRKVNNHLINKPLQFRFFKDIENPYYNQLFYYPSFNYNLYDGAILGVKINNKSFLKKNFEFSIKPNYSTKSNNLTGSYSFSYNHFIKNANIYKIGYGFSGSSFHYAPKLKYTVFTPSISVTFKQNTFRKNGFKVLVAKLISVDKEVEINKQEQDKYNVLSIRYIYSNSDAINNTTHAINTELHSKFSKITTDFRYRKFFTEEKSYQIRFFGGYFFYNKSEGNYYSFALNNGADYLFEQNLFGRSESQGLFSQQFIVNQGGFKSNFKEPQFSNKFITAVNTSVNIFNKTEIYNDFAILINKNSSPKYYYENGIRLNFLPNIFEFYFPIYTNEGFEITKEAYPTKIRFVITTSVDRIYNFIRRSFL